MSLWSKFRDIAREQANQSFRSVTQNSNTQISNGSPTLCKVIAQEGTQFTVLLPTGDTKFVYAVGSRSIGIGDTAHLIGDSIF